MAEHFIPIPARTAQSACRSCGQFIYWAPHPTTGRPHPVSTNHEDAEEPTPFADGCGISHFSDCPTADQHRSAGLRTTPASSDVQLLDAAEKLPLLGATTSWDGWGAQPLGKCPDKVLRTARRWFTEKLKATDDARMSRQVAAINVILADREAHSPQGVLAL